MEIRLLDRRDDADCAAAYRVWLASQRFERPWADPDGEEQTIAAWRHEDPAEPLEIHLAVDGGDVLGLAKMWLPMEDNTSKTWVELDVAPEHRRRGVGTALIERVVERARDEKRPEVMVETSLPADVDDSHPHLRFAAAMGFEVTSMEIGRHLQLPVPEDLLDRLDRESRDRWQPAYRLETYVDGVPEPLRESLCYVENQLIVDAPTGSVDYEPESLTPERYQEYLDLERQQDRRRLTTVALVGDTDDVVAFTDMFLPAGAPERVWQGGTLVRRDHRGHRLGMAVKVENLRRLQADYPGRRIVATGNDETNRWMVAINERLGFRIVERYAGLRRVLDLG